MIPNILQVSQVKIIYQPKVKASQRYTVRNAKEAQHFLFMYCYDMQTIEYRESFKVVYLNSSNKVLGFTTHSEGGSDSAVIDVRQIVQACLLANAKRVIISHNHPTGTLKPSTYDDMTTNKIKKALESVDIDLADHIIISPEGIDYYSYADEGRL
ncbi:JAB domain-containing protein [uncultured Culturomica sp.]|jgi:DNA repair protein RadC|uniref:JAB domain-containing protein n=1 Tax=uncultured Culturomica sp. TaxID=1926654 RepID=UPI000336586A|nr:JAB domain-containing protein [uncultured Culturomica sp.]CCZ06933.1 putative uncharacterized protein [Odoribacter sp. CAG:788]